MKERKDSGDVLLNEGAGEELATFDRRLLESMPDSVSIHSEGRFRYINSAGAKLFSAADPGELLGKPLIDLAHSDSRRAIEESLQHVLERNEQTIRLEVKLLRLDQQVIDAEVAFIPVTFLGGFAVQAIIRDVGEQNRAAASLRASEYYYRDLVEHSRDLMCTHDLNGRIISINEAVVKTSGYDLSHFLNKDIRDFLAPEFRLLFDDYLVTIQRDGHAEGLMQVQTGTGERRIWQYYNTLRTEGVSAPIVRGMAHDITDIKRAQEKILELNKELEERIVELQTLLDVIPIGIGIADDPQCERIQVNPYFAKALGILPNSNGSLGAPADERPKNFKVISGGRELSTAELPMQYAAANRVTVKDVEVDVVHDDGVIVNLLEYAAPVLDKDGNVRGCIGAFLDVTERKRAEEALRQSERDYRGLFENAHDAIMILDPDNEIVLDANQRACEMYCMSRPEFIGLSLETVSKDLYMSKSRVKQTLDSESPLHFETVQSRKDGSQIFIEVNASVVNYKGSRAILIINRDITERRLAEQERERLLANERAARAEAQAANRIKDEFLAMVSHELRTPLTSILLWAHMLRTGKLDETAAIRGLETVERSARAQAKLIEDILDVSRIVSGKLNLNIRSTDLLSIIAAAIEVVRPAVIAKGIDLQVKVDASVGQIQGDSDRLQQVVWNLLSNAAKFTDEGGRIEVKLERADQHALITVSDTGQGISPEFLPYVFDRFRQAESLLTRRHSGLGLGLAIVRHLVEMHGGSVRAESAGEGSGSAFKVKLPLTEGRSIEATQATELEQMIAATECTSSNSSSVVKGLRVLVVDDDAATREAISAMLEQGGAEVTACSSAAEAMEMMQMSRPDVLVCDLAMPDEDGYSLISKVRALSRIQGGQVPALALTAHVRMEDRLKALSSGYQLFMPKPVEVNELLVSIAALVRITDKAPI